MSTDWLSLIKRYWYCGVIGLLLVIIGIIGYQAMFQRPVTKNEAVFSNSSVIQDSSTSAQYQNTATEAQQTGQTIQKGFVDVKGAVKKPGIYVVTDNTRLFDVIRKAGGLAEDADQKQVNLAQQVSDQQIIFIPKVGEEVPAELGLAEQQPTPAESGSTIATTGSADGQQATGQTNLNTATAEELQQLTGIGQKKAELIINFRTEQGGFKQIEDLKKVSGIGEKTFESLKDSITV
ncbi:helix-hairpin-helix domain-containing protein [Loigolactobacillus backii]|uniref:Competence protein ComE n=1 Tax=Loigolactobacillus backii TaxID=375175 RepID=A0A192H410_9LACO|nr:helix-hairpin-helix domain-containing protein [Loigolactobacillus backii]ANK63105.1 competence protein ComE [Loigolactobacillus backii]ANK69887.1 competence protein ComE [Loigolactobacillus backii]MDA5387109.1 helix-hairpin-helix domain-containing protein [Loigolactobacillus backii]MDA5389668.1 helix-hairpin-helix domain-containing protein [Loigolactobacillus backii]